MSHTHNTPPSNFSTADLPTDMAEGSVAFDTDTQELVAYKNGSWESLGSGGGGGIGSTTYVRDNVAGVIDQIQGDIPANWKNADSSLKGLVIGTSCTSIGSNAFYSCSALTGSLVIPDSVTTIGSGAFNACFNLTGSLTIGNSVTSIGAYAFADTSFEGAIVIPDSVTSIGSYAFYYCNSFSSLYVNTPASSWVGSNALTGAGLTTIYVNGVTALGYTSGAQTFQGKSLTIAEWTNYPNTP